MTAPIMSLSNNSEAWTVPKGRLGTRGWSCATKGLWGSGWDFKGHISLLGSQAHRMEAQRVPPSVRPACPLVAAWRSWEGNRKGHLWD